MFKKKRKEIVAIIPARGGSKGIHKKNLQQLDRIPLIAYSILVAQKVKQITRIVVSTDSEEIVEIARHYGAEVPFLRPSYLADDKAKLSMVFDHILLGLKEIEGYTPDVIVHMLPSHPFRSPELLKTLLYKINEGYQSVITVKPIHLNHFAWCIVGTDKSIKRIQPTNISTVNHVYRSYGLLYARYTHPSPLGQYVHCLQEPTELIDIDDPDDFFMAEQIIKNGLYTL
ncbi:MAG: acylneuraminate cytidylyltransferase family protein [Desulfamplus sp.]|nr:acylneuraminate cytidylyltransferase family protein [Desulfamplus sp.]